MTTTFKTGDLFIFTYNENASKKFYDPYHCFDGKLIFRENGKLEDTYWGSGGNRWFTTEEAHNQGCLKFIVNLNDVELIKEYETVYYDDSDIFDLSSQHGCYKKFSKRKGAKKSIDKMKLIIKKSIDKKTREIQYLSDEITRLHESLLKIANGETEGIYIN